MRVRSAAARWCLVGRVSRAIGRCAERRGGRRRRASHARLVWRLDHGRRAIRTSTHRRLRRPFSPSSSRTSAGPSTRTPPPVPAAAAPSPRLAPQLKRRERAREVREPILRAVQRIREDAADRAKWLRDRVSRALQQAARVVRERPGEARRRVRAALRTPRPRAGMGCWGRPRAEEGPGVAGPEAEAEGNDGKAGKDAVGGLRILDSAKAMLGECGSEGGSAWMASSTFLGSVNVRPGGGADDALLELFLGDVRQRRMVHGLDERDRAHLSKN